MQMRPLRSTVPLCIVLGQVACSGSDSPSSTQAGGSVATTGGGGATTTGGAVQVSAGVGSSTTAAGAATTGGGATLPGTALGGLPNTPTVGGSAATSGGTAGSFGSTTGTGTQAPGVAAGCTQLCAAKSCTDVATCQATCNAYATRSPGAVPCNTQYAALVSCEATLGATNLVCSSDENYPIPVAGQCSTAVCAWAACATDLIVPSDVWARYMNSCPQGVGGATGSGGTSSTGATGGAGGRSATGGSVSGGTSSGGISSKGGATSSSSTASGGTGGVAGSVGTGIPAGYPTPTTANAAKCTSVAMTNGVCPGGGLGPACIQCLFGGTTYNTTETPPAPAEATSLAGDYAVTVQLGGTGPVFISAESSRGLLAAGGSAQPYGFVVDVRPMEGQPNHAGGPVGYSGLDLFFSGPTGMTVNSIGYGLATAASKPVMVYIAGDSTVCDQTGNVYGGWGQMLPQYFLPPVGVANWANSGASSGSFYSSFWGQIKSRWSAGDWALIQFGHNDKGIDDSVVQANLEKYAADAQAANVTPIIISPPARVQFSGSTIGDQSSLHAAAAQAAAKARNCAYIDLTALTITWYNSLGQTASMKYHVSGDATHTNLAGADQIARLVATAIKTQNIGLAKYLR